MKNRDIIRLLNQDIVGEIEAILIYMRDSFVTEQCPSSRKLEETAKDEMRHVEWLAELIVDLGGIPSMEHRVLNFGRSGVNGYLKRAIELEKEAIGMYREHIGLIGDGEIAEKLRHILEEEEGHLKEFQKLLKGEKS